MKRTLYSKFIMAYILLGVLGTVLIATLGSSLIQNHILEDTGAALYKEAISLASYQANTDYSDSEDVEAAYNQLKTLSAFQDSRILILNPSGQPLIDTSKAYSSEAQKAIKNFDPAIMGSDSYITGTFHGYFKEDMVSTLVPITKNLSTKGYVSIHLPMTVIIDQKESVLGPVYIVFAILLLCSLLILALFSHSVYQPLKKITAGANEYAAGNLDYNIPVTTNDEMGYLADTLNYMSGELSKSGEYQHKFVANVSHDFRSPLTSIKGYLEAIKDGTIPPELYDKYLGILISETERLNKLTQGMLTLNSLDSKGFLTRSNFDINRVIKDTAATFEGTCNAKDIVLDLTFAADIQMVYADLGKIQQVLYNLIDNAIKFSRENSVIYIQTSLKYEKVFVSVKDTGIGIPKESIKKIWDRFYKSDLSRGKDKKGTGLGLAIVKEIIQAHGENIDVISTQGVGSEFIFTLPKATAL